MPVSTATIFWYDFYFLLNIDFIAMESKFQRNLVSLSIIRKSIQKIQKNVENRKFHSVKLIGILNITSLHVYLISTFKHIIEKEMYL